MKRAFFKLPNKKLEKSIELTISAAGFYNYPLLTLLNLFSISSANLSFGQYFSLHWACRAINFSQHLWRHEKLISRAA